jgi:hypothetical protein
MLEVSACPTQRRTSFAALARTPDPDEAMVIGSAGCLASCHIDPSLTQPEAAIYAVLRAEGLPIAAARQAAMLLDVTG